MLAALLRLGAPARMPRRMPSLPRLSRLQSSPALGPSGFETGDLLMTGLNGAGDISVRVVSCREVVQESILRNDLSTQSGQVLGEVMACTLMMGAGFKGEETLQVNLVGGPTSGIRNVMCISDGELKVRGLVGRPRFTTGTLTQSSTRDFFGDDGQIQIVRNHPTWRQPNTGIVALRGSASVSLNLALYMTESEQRSAFMLTDVKVEGNLCRHALGICVERLPGATEENIEQSIKNVEMVEKKGLRSYLKQNSQDVVMQSGNSEFRDFAPVLDKIIDDCFENMGCELRWTKAPRFRCSCGVDRVWRTLRLLSREDVVSILDEPENEKSVAFTCEFCNTKFALSREEIIEELRL